MADLIDRSPEGVVLDEFLLEGYDSFPGKVYLISVGGDKYACNNASVGGGTGFDGPTVAGGDGPSTDVQKINGLACFPSGDDATTYMGLLAGLSGDIVSKSFEEAREIALSKPILSALFLFKDGTIIDIHYVR